jgi:hypothetical protein
VSRKPPNAPGEPDLKRQLELMVRLSIIPLARRIQAGQCDADAIHGVEDLIAGAGWSESDRKATDLHLDRSHEILELVEHCRAQGEHGAAVVLLYTLLESCLNSAVRVLMTVHGFSHAKISEALKGTDLETKADVLLPLLRSQLHPRARQTVMDCRAIRNMIVHDKARPAQWDAGGIPPHCEAPGGRPNPRPLGHCE